MFRFWKTAKAVANLFMIFLSWRWYEQGFGMEFAVGCLILSSMWLALSFGQMSYLLRTYTTNVSRLQVHLPLWFGLFLSGAALWHGEEQIVRVLAVVSLLGWFGFYGRYRINKRQFEKQGHGVLPKGIMINPPFEILPPGSILLMSGIADVIGEAVGHGEIVIPDGKGKWAFSTYMKYGTVMNPLEEVLPRRAKHGITVARVPVVPWTEEDCKHALLQARSMQRQNKEWVVRSRRSREKLIAALPLPAVLKRKIKEVLDRRFAITGYDWFGLFLGRVKMDHWTCIGSVQELLWRMGKTLDQTFGTGLLGAGTSILDPIMPARFFDLKCYRNLTIADYEAWKVAQRRLPEGQG
jgi:hypothetical protein